ncbi:CheY-like chemotaxis protein [Rhabdobacter roseus]|uniref:CheY-like chemotaxis protein n=1 Tax=Rhabdobacter roseus TaxID=1655419 RepID=A0A840TMV9_9BACT|nr:CheY-like chemotaxis protein [Rhabdobacter roseus]
MTCLVIEDDLDDQEIFSIALGELGQNYQSTFANNAVDALSLIRSGAVVADYIFIDLNMPKLNGLQCLAEIRKEPGWETIPVYLYSTSSEQIYVDQALQGGAQAFITKPSRISDFTRILGTLLVKA